MYYHVNVGSLFLIAQNDVLVLITSGRILGGVLI
jgi:hypothetical protein